jgi:bifunctional DNA-binding transcriptional regulator/antitoxin component of YhaV-PrlF toxin-antitoxin module
MSKVTSKYQVTLPRAIARAHRIVPGAEIAFESAGESLRVHLVESEAGRDTAECLAHFDAATERQRRRNKEAVKRLGPVAKSGRGWTREDLYQRGRAR